MSSNSETSQTRASETAGLSERRAPGTVTLCGSMRFYPQILTVAAELTVQGVIVLAPFLAVAPEAQQSTRAEVKYRLDELHREKILRSDAVIVVSDESGYYGESTAGEIAFAQRFRLPVTYRRLSARDAAAVLAELSGAGVPVEGLPGGGVR